MPSSCNIYPSNRDIQLAGLLYLIVPILNADTYSTFAPTRTDGRRQTTARGFIHCSYIVIAFESSNLHQRGSFQVIILPTCDCSGSISRPLFEPTSLFLAPPAYVTRDNKTYATVKRTFSDRADFKFILIIGPST